MSEGKGIGIGRGEERGRGLSGREMERGRGRGEEKIEGEGRGREFVLRNISEGRGIHTSIPSNSSLMTFARIPVLSSASSMLKSDERPRLRVSGSFAMSLRSIRCATEWNVPGRCVGEGQLKAKPTRTTGAGGAERGEAGRRWGRRTWRCREGA